MKTFIILLVILFSCSSVFAAIDSLGGFAWVPVTKTYTTTGTSSGAIVWTPASGNKIVLLGAVISGSAKNTSELETNFTAAFGGTDILPPIISTGPIVIASGVPIWQGTADQKIHFTTVSPGSAVTLWGYETK